jgi:hypothetical protein
MLKRSLLLIGLVLCCFFSFSQTLTQAEYFWDTDPGEGNGTVLLALDGNFDSAIEDIFEDNFTLPSTGNHTFNIRVKDNNSNWGPIFSKAIEIQQTIITNGISLTQAEYFWDTDPGEGSGTVILALDGNFDSAIEDVFGSLVFTNTGNMIFNIRVKDNNSNWGPVFKKVINIPYGVLGCMDAIAFNYNSSATLPGFCEYCLYGCMDSTAFNYDSLAFCDDGSCIPFIYGCTDPSMLNYDASSNTDDGSCIAFIYGCTDATMFNYSVSANTDDGSCIPFIYGCMDSIMFNYNASANTNDGSCIQFVYGCMDSTMLNYNASANTNDGSCTMIIYGCMDSTMFNFNPIANSNDSSCVPFIYGCIDSTAYNYNSTSNTDDGSCIASLFGCTDPSALNYDSIANTDDGSCVPFIYGCLDSTAYNYNSTSNTDDGSCLYCDYMNNDYISDMYFTDVSCYGGNDGSIYGIDLASILLTGVSPFSYSIDSGLTFQSSNTFNNLSAGDYYITYMDGNGCINPNTSNYWIDINEPDSFNYSSIINNVSCDGLSDGSITINPIGISSPSFLWSNGYSTQSIDSLDVGNYYVIISDANNCIDSVYFNLVSNGICGCTDTTAFNYNSNANIDNGSCIPYIYGCTDSAMFNYNELANTDDGGCIPIVFGCTDFFACNYDSLVTIDDSSCVYPTFSTVNLSGCDSVILNNNIYYTSGVYYETFNSITSGTASLLTYCASNPLPDFDAQDATYIQHVQLAGDNSSLIDNNTIGINDFYEDYTATMYAEITEGNLYTINVTIGDLLGSSYNGGAKVFIDYNIDGDFLDAGEDIGIIPVQASAGTSVPLTFNAPTTGAFGATRMRVVAWSTNDFTTPNDITPCESPAAGSWANPWFGATEDYSIVLNNPLGYSCDSIVAFNLTIYPSSTSTSSVSACDSYTWNGTTYTSSGTYTYSSINSVGCDSTAILNFTLDICGCTDSLAPNFDPLANTDDSSCVSCYALADIGSDTITACDSVLISTNLISNGSYVWTTSNDTIPPALTPSIGDFFQGGVVFWINPNDSTQGLSCDIVDLVTTTWGCMGISIPGAYGTNIGSGKLNTLNILTGCFTSGIAAANCYNSNNGGYSDWFLPSQDELNEIYLNKNIINSVSISNGGNPIVNPIYWSSTEYNNNQSYYQNLDNGSQIHDNKDGNYDIRAIRSFSTQNTIIDTTNSVMVSASGWNYVTVTDSLGCTATDSVYVNIGINGCMDSAAFNYNATATCDNGSCIAIAYGCTDSLALNYDSFANTDDSTCCGAPFSAFGIQLGQDIDGQSAGEQSGRAVSISDDGNIVAIGAPVNGTGNVKIYNWNGTSWNQLGLNIDGESPSDYSGYSVSLSSDGYTVAIGSIFSNNQKGHVSVYNWDGSNWMQVGQDIDGEAADDYSGYSVSISADGYTVAIGSKQASGGSGHVRIFNWDGSSWIQLGQNISGASWDLFGMSVSLSSDGNKVAIGAPWGNNDNSGYTKVFENINGTWNQIGQNINGESSNDDSGLSVSLSSDGNKVAIGAPGNDNNGSNSGHVRVYENVNGSWMQIGQDIDGETAGDASGGFWDASGTTISLSSNGNILAVGATGSHNGVTSSSSGYVRLYSWDGSNWSQVGVDIDGENIDDLSGFSVALSNDGARLAIGAPNNDGNGSNSGHVRVFNNGYSSPPCSGCTDSLAVNYDPYSLIDDGTCTYTILGCTDSNADNYNSSANTDDGSCYYCNISNSITISNPSNLTACDGWAITNSFSSYPIISYTWLNSQGVSVSTTNFAMNLCNDTYTLNVIDSAGCVAVDTILIGTTIVNGCTDPVAYNYNPLVNIDDGSCLYCDLSNTFMVIQNTSNNCNGLILANPSSSNLPITFLWNNGSTQNNITNLCTGIYTVSITDAAGCSLIDSVTIGTLPIYGCTDPTADNYNSSANSDDGSCYSCNISNTISITNPSNLTTCDGWALTNSFSSYPIISYTWLNSQGVSVSTTNFAMNLCNDTYIISVTDSAGCVANDTLIIGILDVYGCTDPLATNYDATATTDDGSCTYPVTCAKPVPTGIYIDEIIQVQAKIHWDDMSSATCMALKYYVNVREVGTTSWSWRVAQDAGLCNQGLSTTSKVMINLTAATDYEYRVKAFYCNTTGSSAWSPMGYFTTADACDNVTNFTATPGPQTARVVFSWDTVSAYSMVRIKLRVDSISNPTGSDWQMAGGFGVNYPALSVNKWGLTPGQTYRGQARTWCNPAGGLYRSANWTSLVWWTQPTSAKIEGGTVITNLAIYPNPSRDVFNITFTTEEKQNLKVRILNVIGEALINEDLQQFIGEYTKQIDLTNNAKGIYFLEIETNNGMINKKLILQ